MDAMYALIRRLLHEDSGQDMVEYVLIFALVSVVAITAVAATGEWINAFWGAISAVLEGL
jgi:Flp pilus assembly pilin Flp